MKSGYHRRPHSPSCVARLAERMEHSYPWSGGQCAFVAGEENRLNKNCLPHSNGLGQI